MCFSLFAVACSDNKDSETKLPSYSYSEVDEGKITNASFNIGTANTSLTSFPINPNGWTLSKDTDEAIINSYAKSGAVKTTDSAWDELMATFYNDSTLLSYALYSKGVTEADVKEEIKSDPTYNPDNKANFEPTTAQIKEYTIDKYLKTFYINPSAQNNSDSVVYMLNNYRTKQNFGLGSSRKITSSNEITLEKGTIGKFSVYIKTQNLLEQGNYGANIRITNTFNGITQGEYAVTNIVANDWTLYEVYVQGDAQYDCTVKLALGLGYGLEGVTEGTVFFDNVNYEVVDSIHAEINSDSTSTFVFNNTDSITKKNLQKSLYKLSLNDYLSEQGITFFAPVVNDLTDAKVNYTSTDLFGSCEDKFDDTFKGILSTTTLTASDSPYGKEVKASTISDIKNASITLTYDDFSVVDCQEYAIVSFYVKNQLSKFGSTNISFNVYDMLAGKTDIINRDSAVILDAKDEWQIVNIVIKNNFVDDNDPATLEDVARNYKIEVIVGPTALSASQYKDEYASGSITITTPLVAQGKIYTNKDDAKKDNVETIYDLYSMYSNGAQGIVPLFAGLTADRIEDTTTDFYTFSVAQSDIGSILTHPSNVKGYQGIEANHIYVKEDQEGVTLETATNTRVNGENGSYAGLINTKYDYSSILPDLASKLNFKPTDTQKSIQPIMIYNNAKDNYGYIGSSNMVAANSYALVAVTLRVVDDAKANIYLVNTAEQAKTVLSFKDFTYNNVEYKGSDMKLQLEVSADMMDQNGWVTLEFYIGTGASDKNFRVEVWNGSRDGGEGSQGYVFVKDISVITNEAFTEPVRKEDAFTISDNPLYKEQVTNGQPLNKLIAYKQQLNDLEIQFNNEQESSATMVSYREKYVWAQNDTFIYAVYRTIDPIENDPYANQEEDEDTSIGCVAETDPSTFWLSFSSILLIVALVVALAMLIIKTLVRKHKANANDAKSHFVITSRTKKDKKTAKVEKVDDAKEEVIEEEIETEAEVVEEEVEQPTSETEEDNSYIYGDVEVFGEDGKPTSNEENEN